jgi:predicted XRE-type DNA-binding protein
MTHNRKNSPAPIKDAKIRFWSQTSTGAPNRCWTFTGDINENGYGRISINGRKMYAHRFSYMIHHDLSSLDIQGIVIRHTCDNPRCVNPNHLLPGTRTDNHKDMVERGRHTIGETHPGVKLNEKTVREIRHLFETHSLSQVELARAFGVHQASIHDIVRRKTWKHI